MQGGFVACVNILPSIRSIYRWKDVLQQDTETLMIMKTERIRFPGVEKEIRSMHSYETPEIISLSLENGFEGYLQWITECVSR